MTIEWRKASASDLGRGIGDGSVDPVELAEVMLEAASSDPIGARTFVRLTRDRALAEAGAARDRARQGLRRGPLDGVPISWKDLFDTAGTETEAGTRLLAGRVPDRDARVLANATAAGLVCLGKTHLSELAFAGLGYNPVTDTPPCVNDHDAVPGGSSSGAAASVAFGYAAAGIGSDTGGSVRVPAAWNDLVGLKTTAGHLSLDGVVPLCPWFDTVGPLTRTVEDAAALFATLSGDDAADLEGSSLRGARIAVLETVATDDLDPAPAEAFDASIKALDAAGAKVVRLNAPEVNEAMALAGILYTTEAYATWGAAIEAEPDKMFDRVRDRFLAGAAHNAADYVRAWQALLQLRDRWRDTVADMDAVALPTSPILPPKQARVAEDGDYYVAQNLMTLRNTRIGNLFGLSALTVPTGIPSCGLMLMGAPLAEHRLLRLGVSVETALAQV